MSSMLTPHQFKTTLVARYEEKCKKACALFSKKSDDPCSTTVVAVDFTSRNTAKRED